VRIAMVAACPFPSPQGSQVFVRQMCRQLVARGHDVHLLTYGQGRDLDSDHRDGFVHHRIRRLPGDDAMRSGPTLVKPVLDAMMIASLDRLARHGDYDLLHCHNYEAAVIGLVVRARRRVPVVYHSHNLMSDELGTYFQGRVSRRLAGAAGRMLDRSVPRRVDHAIALCDHSADAMRRGGARADRVSVIPAAIDDDGPRCSAGEARRRLGLPGGRSAELVVGYCGNLDAYQNLDLLLDAVSLLAADGAVPGARLLVATHARDAAFERALAARGLAGNATVLATEDFDSASLAMAAADVLVLPRRHGSGYPIKLLNYMSAGRPIVTAGCGGKVVRDGVDGLVVPDDDPHALAAAVRRTAADPALGERLGHEARRRFLASLTWNSVLPAVEDVYAEVTGRQGTPKAARAV